MIKRVLIAAIAAILLSPATSWAQTSGYCGMVTACPQATLPLTGSEVLSLVQGGVTKQAPLSAIVGSSGIQAINGTAGQILASTTNSVTTLSLPSTITLPLTFSGQANFTGGLQIGGTSLTIPFPVSIGGTGRNALTTNALLAGNGTSAVNLIAEVDNDCLVGTAGAWAPGSCTTGAVTSISGTAGQITASASTGAVTLSLPTTITQNETFSGTLNASGTFEIGGTAVSLPLSVSNGGTGRATLTANSVLVGAGTSQVSLVAEVDGDCLIGSSGSWTAGSCATAGVSSISGTSGQITASASTGAVTLSLPTTITQNEAFSGTLNASGTFEIGGTTVSLPISVANGGTGQSSLTASDLLLGNGTSAVAFLAPVNGDCVVGSGGAWTAGSCTGSSPAGVGVAGGESAATVGDSNSNIASGHYIVNNTATLTAARTWTLPTASAFGAHILHFYDLAGGISGTDTGSLLPSTANTDEINGSVTALLLNTAYSSVDLYSDGQNPGHWTLLSTGGLTAIANNTVLGNVSGVSAVPTAISKTQLTTLCNTFSSSLSGCVPSTTGTTSGLAMLRNDGTWTNGLTTSAASTNVFWSLNNSGVSGGFAAGLQVTNSAREWEVGAFGAASGLSSSGEFAWYDVTANKVRLSIGPTGGLDLWSSSGAASADSGAGTITAPSSGGFFLNASNSYGLFYPGTSPTPGGGPQSLVGLNEAGVNIIGSKEPSPIIDVNTNNSGGCCIQSGRYVPTLDSDWQQQADMHSILSINDQIQPANFALSGTFTNGDTIGIQVAGTLIPGGVATYTCTYGSGPCTSNTTAAAYLGNQINANLLASYSFFAECSAGTCGVLTIRREWTAALTNDTTSSTGRMTISAGGNSCTTHGCSENFINALDGPVGLTIYRNCPNYPTNPCTGGTAPQDNDNTGSIRWLGMASAFPSGGTAIAEIVANVANVATPLGQLSMYTDCVTSDAANGCQRMIIQQGLALPDSSGAFNDSGQGTVNVPYSGGYFFGNSSSGVESASAAVIELFSTASVTLNTPNSKCSGAGLFTDAAGNVGCLSDARFKRINGTLTEGLAALERLGPARTWDWSPDSGFIGSDLGWTAQNVVAAIPEARVDLPGDRLSYKRNAVEAALVNAVLELSARVKTLEGEKR